MPLKYKYAWVSNTKREVVRVKAYVLEMYITVPCEQLVSPTPNERETTASNRLLFHRACASSSRPTWCIWCQVHLSIIFFSGIVSVQKNQNVSHPKRWQKNDSILTVFLLSFCENDSAVSTEKNAISSRLLCLPTVNSAFYSHGTKKANKVSQLWRVLAFYRIALCLNAAVVLVSACVRT